MTPSWFRPRGYRHLDSAIGPSYANKVSASGFAAGHSWSPLISYVKREKRYKPLLKRTIFKDRDIMYASHRDAAVFACYAFELTRKLDEQYAAAGLGDSVIAYRSLGKSNYDFTGAALDFAVAHAPCRVMCFDVTGFFDNLDHQILKRRLASVVGVDQKLSSDWFAVFRAVTRFNQIPLATLRGNAAFKERFETRTREPIATMAEVVKAGIKPLRNPNKYGIPQGTPISAVLANLYMWPVDVAMKTACDQLGALYQRYSDDILVICKPDDEPVLEALLKSEIGKLKLTVKDEKTEKSLFDPADPQTFQYLGFNVSPRGAVIRPGSLGRQWRKARRSLRRTEEAGRMAIAAGKADKVYTKKLRRRFSPVGLRNFSSYGRRAAKSLKSKAIIRQLRRLERMVDETIKAM